MFNFKPNLSPLTTNKVKKLSLKDKLLALGRNNEGIAAVEFALLSPVMILLYFGLVEISMIIHADKMTSHASNVAGDLATQVANMDLDDVEDIFEATLATMSLPADQIDDVKIELLSYRMLADGTREQLGTATLNGGYDGTPYNPEDIGTRLLTTTSGAMVARVQYNYESVTSEIVSKLTVLDETFILKPRSSADIPFSLDGTPRTYTCTAAGSITVGCS